MFSKNAIFAISALAISAFGLTATFTGCPIACPTNYLQTSACECCPEANLECDAKYNKEFCYGSGADTKLDLNSIPLSCPQRQAKQTCTNTCANFEIRGDNCQCCPVSGMECNASFNNKYCNTDKTFILNAFASTCPQKQKVTATCPASATCTAPDSLNANSCECCPDATLKCGASGVSSAFTTKYCKADNSFNFANLAPSCPQNKDPSLRTT